MTNICAPALIYLVFSLIQIITDIFGGLFNQALLKFMVMILFTLMLNTLCTRGLGVVSWMIVFIPFMLMSLITAIVLFIFGLNPSTGQISPASTSSTQTQTSTKTVLITPTTVDSSLDVLPPTADEVNHYNNTV